MEAERSLSTAEQEKFEIHRRVIRNRESAKRSRDARKSLIESLTKQVEARSRQNQALEAELKELRSILEAKAQAGVLPRSRLSVAELVNPNS